MAMNRRTFCELLGAGAAACGLSTVAERLGRGAVLERVRHENLRRQGRYRDEVTASQHGIRERITATLAPEVATDDVLNI